MFDIFAAYLRDKALLTDTEIVQVHACTVSKKIRKRQYLLQEREVCHYNCFVVKGCMRSYRVGEDGAEHIMTFALPNWWVSDQESYNNGTPSKNNIDALADSELLLIEKKDWDKLVSDIPAFRDWRDNLKSKNLDDAQNRIMSHISDSAEEQYKNFITSFPDIFNSVPLHMVASYLGVSRETLSRIRNNYFKS
ncbi:MAG: Crp/Fnr family transcriptional regulator [Mucilaginibacter sp.]